MALYIPTPPHLGQKFGHKGYMKRNYFITTKDMIGNES